MAAFKIIAPGSNEARDLQEVLKKHIDQVKEELTTLDLTHDDSVLRRGQILGWRQLLTKLVTTPVEQSLIDDGIGF